jgi:hypothetical protein
MRRSVGIYQRHDYADEKRVALERWAVHLAAIVAGGAEVDNVVDMAQEGMKMAVSGHLT